MRAQNLLFWLLSAVGLSAECWRGQALLELLTMTQETSNLASLQPLSVAPISFFPKLLQGEPLVCAVGQAGSIWTGDDFRQSNHRIIEVGKDL